MNGSGDFEAHHTAFRVTSTSGPWSNYARYSEEKLDFMRIARRRLKRN